MSDDEELTPEMAKKKWSPGYLYILDRGDGKTFKIGITSKDPQVRRNQITRNFGQLTPDLESVTLVVSCFMDTNPYYLEQLLHMEYSYCHVGGEWFEFEEGFFGVADLLEKIKPFGILEYYDRWYELVPEDYMIYVAKDVLPKHLEYSQSAMIYPIETTFNIVTSDKESFERSAQIIRQQKNKYAKSLEDVSFKVSLRGKNDLPFDL